MKVFFLPWNGKNPYQRNLAAALGHHGVEVTGCQPATFAPVLSLLWRHGRPDVLHLHWISGFVVSRFRLWALLSSALLLAELWIMRALGVRIVWTIHNLVEHKKRDVRFELRVLRRVARFCHAVVVHGERSRQVVAEAYAIADAEERIVTILHGNYLGNYPDEVDSVTARARLGIEPDSFVYLFFGMMQPYKGLEELMEAFGALDDPTATLLLVGSCRDRGLRDRILAAAGQDERVCPVLQYIEDRDIQYFMRAANAAVLPFNDVFTSGSAVLAMGFGCALVVPQLGCLPDYVDSHGGVLYDPGNGQLLAALQRVACADWEAMGRRNRAAAIRLDWAGIAAATLSTYRSPEVLPRLGQRERPKRRRNRSYAR